MSYPRYVPHSTGSGKWNHNDINAVVDHVLAGATATGYIAYPYSYLIRALAGGVYDAIDSTGNLTYGGADDAGSVDGSQWDTVMRAALADLTAGRTHKEKIILYGNFTGTIDSEINVPSHTHIDLMGSITVPDSFDETLWALYSSGDEATVDIEIEGGYYDLGTQSAGDLVFARTTGGYFHDITTQDGYLPFYVEPTSIGCQIQRCIVNDAGIQAINVGGVNCGAIDCTVDGGCTEFGMIANAGYNNYVINNTVKNVATGAYAIELGYNSKNNVISGNNITSCGGASGGGIIALAKDSGYFGELTATTGASISNNTVRSTKRCIWLYSALENSYPLQDCTVSNNILEAQASSYGITSNIENTSHTTYVSGISVIGNIIRKAAGASSTTGISLSGANNICRNNDVTGLDTTITSINNSWSPNFSASDNAGTTSSGGACNVLSSAFAVDATGSHTLIIPHGLARTPTASECQLSIVAYPNGSDALAKDWVCTLLEVDSRNVDATNVVAVVNVGTASVTAGTTAKVALHIGNP